MKKLFMVLAVIMFPIYIVAYGISNLFKFEGTEDMPTVREWFHLA